MLPIEKARESVEALVEQARIAGADAADALYVCSESQSVQVRLGELEHVDRSEGEEMGLRVFVGHRSASVASSDFSPEAMRELVARAVAMAREAPEDPYAGLASAELIASGPFPDIDSEDRSSDDPQTLQNRALAAEKAALGGSRRDELQRRVGRKLFKRRRPRDVDRIQRRLPFDRS